MGGGGAPHLPPLWIRRWVLVISDVNYDIIKQECVSNVKAQIPLDASRHITTRHDTLYSPCILEQGKVVTCCVTLIGQQSVTSTSRQARQARLARHVFRGVSTAWTGVVMSTSLFSRKCSCNWCKSRAQKTKLVHESTTAFSLSAMLEQARRDTHDKHDTLITTRRACRFLTWRNKWNLGFSKDVSTVDTSTPSEWVSEWVEFNAPPDTI